MATTAHRFSRLPVNAIVPARALRTALAFCAIVVLAIPIARADSSTPRLAAYYDRYLAICAGDAYQWTGEDTPKKFVRGIVQVGVGRSDSYALTQDGRLQAWTSDARDAVAMLDGVQSFAAGNSGVLAIKADGSLWRVERTGSFGSGRVRSAITPVAASATAASVGDGTDYYVTADGGLYAKGNAQRGQYGDGRLEGTASFARVATGVRAVRSHTGHAILLDERGEVQGTGGNIYGPLGRHGLGDKAVRWGPVFGPAIGIATGASHSLAIRADGTLWIWGRNESPDPRQVLAGVIGTAAGSDSSLALTKDGSLWQWRTGARPRKVLDCEP